MKRKLTDQQRQLFDSMMDEIVDALPQQLKELLEEVPVIVDDEPSAAELRELEIDDDSELFGLHWGIPLTERSIEHSGVLPDQIKLYRGPILRMAMHSHRRWRDELYKQIHITLLHEIGHHFGLDEDDLEQLGYG